jgi:hypothetical protein
MDEIRKKGSGISVFKFSCRFAVNPCSKQQQEEKDRKEIKRGLAIVLTDVKKS